MFDHAFTAAAAQRLVELALPLNFAAKRSDPMFERSEDLERIVKGMQLVELSECRYRSPGGI